MNVKFRAGSFVDYIGPSREGLKHGDTKMVNDSDEFGVRLVGVRGYFDHADFTPSMPAFQRLSAEERSKIIEAMLNPDLVVQFKNDKGIWQDAVKSKLLVLHKHIVYRIKPEALTNLDILYQQKATAQQMLCDVEKQIHLAKKGQEDDSSSDE